MFVLDEQGEHQTLDKDVERVEEGSEDLSQTVREQDGSVETVEGEVHQEEEGVQEVDEDVRVRVRAVPESSVLVSPTPDVPLSTHERTGSGRRRSESVRPWICRRYIFVIKTSKLNKTQKTLTSKVRLTS